MLYWCYGSNLNVAHMAHRCPKAKVVGPLILEDGALVFRGVADVVTREGSIIPGGLWRITPECEAKLDQYEGVAGRLYLKRYLELKVGKKREDCLFYQMAMRRGVQPPSEGYFNTIVQGYKDFDLDLVYLNRALEESWNEKELTPHLRERYIKRGMPSLAKALAS